MWPSPCCAVISGDSAGINWPIGGGWPIRMGPSAEIGARAEILIKSNNNQQTETPSRRSGPLVSFTCTRH